VRRGEDPTVLRRLPSGYVVIDDTQFLPGYGVLLGDPEVAHLSELDLQARERFLVDMRLVGEAIGSALTTSSRTTPAEDPPSLVDVQAEPAFSGVCVQPVTWRNHTLADAEPEMVVRCRPEHRGPRCRADEVLARHVGKRPTPVAISAAQAAHLQQSFDGNRAGDVVEPGRPRTDTEMREDRLGVRSREGDDVPAWLHDDVGLLSLLEVTEGARPRPGQPGGWLAPGAGLDPHAIGNDHQPRSYVGR
jgi:hypothetical protein